MSLFVDLSNVMQLQQQLQMLQSIVDRERRNKVSLDNKRQSLEAQIEQLTGYTWNSISMNTGQANLQPVYFQNG